METVSKDWENDEDVLRGDWKTIEETDMAGLKKEDPCYLVAEQSTKCCLQKPER